MVPQSLLLFIPFLDYSLKIYRIFSPKKRPDSQITNGFYSKYPIKS